MRLCKCESPYPYPAPHRAHACASCGSLIPDEWRSNDATVKEFYDRLDEAIPFDPAIQPLREQAEARELAGRETFGLRHLSRNNAVEATEEFADGAMYVVYEILNQRRRGEDEEWALALTAAYHAAKAHEAVRAMRTHRHQAISDSQT